MAAASSTSYGAIRTSEPQSVKDIEGIRYSQPNYIEPRSFDRHCCYPNKCLNMPTGMNSHNLRDIAYAPFLSLECYYS